MTTAEPPEDLVGVAEYDDGDIIAEPPGFEALVVVDPDNQTTTRVYFLASVVTALNDKEATPYARLAATTAADWIAKAGVQSSPVALRAALEQALAQVQQQGRASPLGEPPNIAMIGLSISLAEYTLARTPGANAVVARAADAERIFTTPGSDAPIVIGSQPASSGPVNIETRRGRIAPGEVIVLASGPGSRLLEPNAVAIWTRGSDPELAARAIIEQAQAGGEQPVAVVVVGVANETVPVTPTRNRPTFPAAPPLARGPRPGDSRQRAPVAATAGSAPLFPWINERWFGPILVAALIGGILGAIAGDQIGRLAAPPRDPLVDRYIESVALLNARGESTGLIQDRLYVLAADGEVDALLRMANVYRGSNDPALRDRAPSIAELAGVAGLSLQSPPQPPSAPPTVASPSAQPTRSAAVQPSPVSATQPTPVGQAPPTVVQPTTATPTPEPTRTGRVKPSLVESVNMRNGPQRNAGLIRQIPPGTQLEILETVEGDAVDAGNRTWYRVRILQVEGYIYSSFVVTN